MYKEGIVQLSSTIMWLYYATSSIIRKQYVKHSNLLFIHCWPKKASSQLGGWLNYDLKQKNKWHYCSFNVSQLHDALEVKTQ
jgi:phage pi2 protein 07